MQQPDMRISLCNSSPPSSLYPYVVFYVTGISIFCRDSDTILLAYSALPSLYPTVSLFQFYSTHMTVFYVSSRLSSKVETRPRCFLLINHFIYSYTHVRTNTHTYARKSNRTQRFTGFRIFLSQTKNFDVSCACACTRVKQDEQRCGTCESWRTELRRKFQYDAHLKHRIS